MRVRLHAALCVALTAPSVHAASPATPDEGCGAEQQLFCPGVTERAEIQRCLRRHRRGLRKTCLAALDGKPAPSPKARAAEPARKPQASEPASPAAAAPAPVPPVMRPDPATPERRRRAAKSFLNVDLPRADGTARVWMAGCPTERCLTVFLAPWCGYCRAATPAVRRLKEHFDARGVHTRVVVGKDKETNIREYAAELGPEAIVDPDWEFRFSGGLPHLFVSIEGGEVLVARPGLRADESPESVAMRLGLK